jgi:polyphosphate kinase
LEDVSPPAPALDLDDPQLFLNRELSLLGFNRRVLEQARNVSLPLLERLRFLTICSTNLDEFFEIRVARLKQQVTFGVGHAAPDGLSAADTLAQVSRLAHELVDEQYRILNDELLPALEEQGIRLLKRGEWTRAVQTWLKRYFESQVLPVLSPLGLDPAHPFPKILNKSLNFIVSLEGDDAFGRDAGIAIVHIARSLPRLIRVPADVAESPHHFVLLSSIVHTHIDPLFPGMRVTGCHQFRTTRNGDLSVDEEDVDDLLQAVQGELMNRRYGAEVRLEVADNCSTRMSSFLLRQFQLSHQDLYQVNGPVNLNRLSALYELVDRPDLKYPAFQQAMPISPDLDMFAQLSRADVLLHHPFQSFRPVVAFLRQAAKDPDVIAIRQTLYRTGSNSPIAEALIEAARSGKEVTVLIELRARFDEAANITYAQLLQEAGATVVYGIVGYKIHCKLLQVVRREGDRLRRYTHIGTGNYHPGTARAYTDFSYMTSRQRIGEDVQWLFNLLTGLGEPVKMNKLLYSPFTLHPQLLQLVENEIEEARAGRPAAIKARMNALTEPTLIRALYRASQAGVQVDLIVRGICRLRPGVPGVSDNVRVRSIIGRFLEHARVFYFYAAGQESLWMGSADWMERNLFKRVEVVMPVEDPLLKARVLHESIELYLLDGEQAWILNPDGRYTRVESGERAAQQVLLERLTSEKPAVTP